MGEEDAENGTVGGDDCAVNELVAGMPQCLKNGDECDVELPGKEHLRKDGWVLEDDRPVVVADERAGVQILDAADAEGAKCDW